MYKSVAILLIIPFFNRTDIRSTSRPQVNSHLAVKNTEHRLTNRLENPLKVRIIYEFSVYYSKNESLRTNGNLCDASNFVEMFDNGDIIITSAPGFKFRYSKISELESSKTNGTTVIKNKVRNSLGADHVLTLTMWENLEYCELTIEYQTPNDNRYSKFGYVLDFKKKL